MPFNAFAYKRNIHSTGKHLEESQTIPIEKANFIRSRLEKNFDKNNRVKKYWFLIIEFLNYVDKVIDSFDVVNDLIAVWLNFQLKSDHRKIENLLTT